MRYFKEKVGPKAEKGCSGRRSRREAWNMGLLWGKKRAHTDEMGSKTAAAIMVYEIRFNLQGGAGEGNLSVRRGSDMRSLIVGLYPEDGFCHIDPLREP